jgi:N-acetyl-S-(2-succino)cysteine monooxygenase
VPRDNQDGSACRQFGRPDFPVPGEKFAEVIDGMAVSHRVRTLNHQGRFFQVRGALNVARPIQGKPVIFHAGQSEAGRDLVAYAADCVFSFATDKHSGIAFRQDMRDRAARLGRDPDSLRILPGISILVAETIGEVRRLEQELGALITPAPGRQLLSTLISMDLNDYPVDEPMPQLPEADIVGMETVRRSIAEMVAREKLTLRQTYERVVPGLGLFVVNGEPDTVSDVMEDWYSTGACDGFVLVPPVMPASLQSFADLVVPELQRRGIFRTEYEGKTTRQIMGLPIPPSIWRLDRQP